MLDTEITPTSQKSRCRSLVYIKWAAVASVFFALVWIVLGFPCLHPTLVVGHSMEPTIESGDLVLITDVSTESLEKGDIIQFEDGYGTIVHRIIEIQQLGNTRVFITKGDNNRGPDPIPVSPERVMGKVVFTVPNVGWVSTRITDMMD